MKNRLQHVLCALDAMERTARMQSPLHRTDARSKLLVTVVFLVTMLSVPLCRLPELMLFFVFPIVACAMGGLKCYVKVCIIILMPTNLLCKVT